ncbi:MAG: hypothetical protein RDV41_15060, partial [Planctomycetota bacterium]|nr:hypothetical protein [Planctomycetota bacterium]
MFHCEQSLVSVRLFRGPIFLLVLVGAVTLAMSMPVAAQEEDAEFVKVARPKEVEPKSPRLAEFLDGILIAKPVVHEEFALFFLYTERKLSTGLSFAENARGRYTNRGTGLITFSLPSSAGLYVPRGYIVSGDNQTGVVLTDIVVSKRRPELEGKQWIRWFEPLKEGKAVSFALSQLVLARARLASEFTTSDIEKAAAVAKNSAKSIATALKAFSAAPAKGKATPIGMVIAHKDRFCYMDIVGDSGLFNQLKPSILASYLGELMSEAGTAEGAGEGGEKKADSNPPDRDLLRKMIEKLYSGDISGSSSTSVSTSDRTVPAGEVHKLTVDPGPQAKQTVAGLRDVGDVFIINDQ